MNFPLRFSMLQRSRRIRRLILAFGSPICCPSVTYSNILPRPLFDTGMKNSCDYKAWSEISLFNGSFVYCPKKLVGHRIHAEAATSVNIKDNSRSNEDFEIISSFWPKWLAKIIFKFYKKAEKSNNHGFSA